jgi:hypothetical protein
MRNFGIPRELLRSNELVLGKFDCTNSWPLIMGIIGFIISMGKRSVSPYVSSLTGSSHAEAGGEICRSVSSGWVLCRYVNVTRFRSLLKRQIRVHHCEAAPKFLCACLKNLQMYTWMSSSFPRPPAKRAVALAFMVNTASDCLSG